MISLNLKLSSILSGNLTNNVKSFSLSAILVFYLLETTKNKIMYTVASEKIRKYLN